MDEWLYNDRTIAMLNEKVLSLWSECKTDDEQFRWIMNWNPFKMIFKKFCKLSIY